MMAMKLGGGRVCLGVKKLDILNWKFFISSCLYECQMQIQRLPFKRKQIYILICNENGKKIYR